MTLFRHMVIWLCRLFGLHYWTTVRIEENWSKPKKMFVVGWTEHQRCLICNADSRYVCYYLGQGAGTRYQDTKDEPILRCKDELVRQVLES